MKFADLQLAEPLCRAIAAENYTEATPIQAATIPHLLKGGDILGCAQTGSGKTASFALPVLQRIATVGKPPSQGEVRALVLTPTRELAIQVNTSFRTYGKYLKAQCAAVYGGVGYGPQKSALRRGLDVLVATPGRLLDLMSEGYADLSKCQFLVLDEADRMLDMGFKKDLERIVAKIPEVRQTILFSATMPKEVEKFAERLLVNPKHVRIEAPTGTAAEIEEQLMFVKGEDKKDLLYELLESSDVQRSIIFTRTKRFADRLAKNLSAKNFSADAIHGNKSQNQRQRSLKKFRDGKVKFLVATDVAARGIDVDEVSHVFNYQLSNEPESYVHRIGRTGRAGNSGIAVTLCDAEEFEFLTGVEKYLGRKIDRVTESEFYDESLAEQFANFKGGGKPKRRSRGGAGHRGGGGRRSSGGGGNSRGRSSGGGRRSGGSGSAGSGQARRGGQGSRSQGSARA